MTDAERQFILAVTDYLHGHYEDPEWGQSATRELLIIHALELLAGKIADEESRRDVSDGIARAVMHLVRRKGHLSSQDPVPP